MTKQEFFHSTPIDIKYRISAYQEEQKIRATLEENHTKMEEYQAWATGLYTRFAIISALDKKVQFPENPLVTHSKDIKEIAKNSGKSEAQLQQELLYMQMRVREVNSRLDLI